MAIFDQATGRLTRRAKLADHLGRLALPPLTLLTAVAGAFLTFDWKEAAKAHPGSSTFMQIMDSWIGLIFFILAISSFIITVIQSWIRPALVDLKMKVDLVGESLRTLSDGLMTDLSSKIGVSTQDQVRLSLYVHDGDQHFVLLGRYSPNPLLRKPGRPYYPDNQGCIAKGWQHGWWFENGLGQGAAYIRNTENRYGIPAQQIPNLSMKSRLYGVQRIDHNGDPLALVVVESMREDRFPSQPLEVTLAQFSVDYGPILRAFRSYAPQPSIAKGRGL